MSRRLPTCDVATTLGRHHEGLGYGNVVVCMFVLMRFRSSLVQQKESEDDA